MVKVMRSKSYCFRIKIGSVASNYYVRADRIDKALASLTEFATTFCCDEHPLEVRTVYTVYALYDDIISNYRNYSIKHKVKPILRLVHSVEFDCDVVRSLQLKDFIRYVRTLDDHSS